MTVRLLALIILLFVVLFQADKFLKSNRYEHLNDLKKVSVEVKDGDIIFRQKATDILDKSFSVDNMDYTEVGIVLEDNQKNRYVFYIRNDEKDNSLRVQKMEDFVKNTEKIGVYNYFKDVDKKVLLIILEFYKKNSIKLYKTEFINEVFFKLFGENIYTNLTNIDGKDIITVKSILSNNKIKKRYEINF